MIFPLFQFSVDRKFSRVFALLVQAAFFLSHASVASAQDVTTVADAQRSENPRADFSPRGPFLGPLEIADIARYGDLPRRMLLEPHMIVPPSPRELDARYVPLFDKTLRDTADAELLETAALSLARIAHEKLQDISVSSDILLRHLETNPDLRVRFACARALINSDLPQSAAAILTLNEHADDSQRLWIEPALAHWKVAPAAAMWKQRLTSKQATSTGVSLACNGLAALDDKSVSELFVSLLQNPLLPYEKRLAAAKALCIVNPEMANDEAAAFVSGDVLDRRLGVELLSSPRPDAQATLATLCTDPSDGIASAAWLSLFRLNPDLLIEALPTGRNHRDAEIRMAAARIMARFPTSERAGWLHEQLSDVHLQVRNVARAMSFQVAEEQPALREEIIRMAGDRLSATPDDWQGIEQCLLLLGQLRATQFSDRCVPLLEHSRYEVLVTSAWLLHLFPDAAVQDAVKDRLKRNEQRFATLADSDFGQQSSYLIQYTGLLRLTDMQPFLEPNFKKSTPGGYYKRAAAMWALGLLHENDPNPDLVKSLLERLADRNSPMPDFEIVRRMSAIALGCMRAKTGVPGLQEAFELDSLPSFIPDSARWSLGMIGEQMPDPLLPSIQYVGGWKLNPLDDF